MLPRLRSFVSALIRREQFEDTLSEELRFHLDAYADDLVEKGLSRKEAYRRARVHFGSVERVREEGEEAFLRAIDLNPSDSQVRGFYSMYLTMMRRFDEAMVQMEEAMELSPLDPSLPSLHAVDLLYMKRYEEGFELARSVLVCY